MSETTNLKLFKHDEVIEENSVNFDIRKSLNENWDKVDDFVAESNNKVIEIKENIDTLNKKQEEIRNLENIIPQGQASGESIILNDSAEYKFKSIELSGNSKQETTTENLFDNTWEQGGVDSNTGEEISSSEHIRTRYIKVFPNHLYSMSRTINTSYNMLRFYDSDKNYLGNQETENMIITSTSDKRMSASVSSMTFTIINADVAYMRLADASNNLSTIYTLTTEAINIDYPSDVKSCGDNVNLLDFTNYQSFTANNTYYAIKANDFNLSSNEEYIFNYIASGDFSTLNAIKLWFRDANNSSFKEVLANNEFSLTEEELNKLSYIQIVVQSLISGRTYSGYIYPKIEKGSVATPYSPYGQGSISEVVSNKNVFNLEEYPFVKGVAYGSDGKAYSWTGYSGISEYFPVNENTTYTFSNDLNKPIYYGLVFYDENKNVISTIFEETITFTTSKDCKYIRFAIQSDVLPTWVQIEKGDTITDYIEHQSQTKTIPTQKPFRKNGDYADTFIKVNEKWYERHYSEREVFDGTENFTKSSTTNIDRYLITISDLIAVYDTTGKNLSSNCFKSGFNEVGCIWQNGNMLVFEYAKYGTTALEEFKAKLVELYNVGTPLYVDYVLATPKDIECTEEQSKILDELQNTKSYKTVTNIYSTDEVSANLDVVYFKDIETLIGGK